MISKMDKDPALLLYVKDYYILTSVMPPEERAAFMDLLVYQHQYGLIPDEDKRLLVVCRGCSIETIRQVLSNNFDQVVNQMVDQNPNQMVSGWLCDWLTNEMQKRTKFNAKKVASGTFAGLISQSKLTKKQIEHLKANFNASYYIDCQTNTEIKNLVNEWLTKTLTNVGNGDANVNEDVIENISINDAVNLYHSICVSLPKVEKITKTRKDKFRLRFIEMDYDIDTLKQVFSKVQESNFMLGKNDRNWKANFDWLMENDQNWVKVLEGKYDNKVDNSKIHERKGSYDERF